MCVGFGGTGALSDAQPLTVPAAWKCSSRGAAAVHAVRYAKQQQEQVGDRKGRRNCVSMCFHGAQELVLSAMTPHTHTRTHLFLLSGATSTAGRPALLKTGCCCWCVGVWCVVVSCINKKAKPPKLVLCCVLLCFLSGCC